MDLVKSNARFAKNQLLHRWKQHQAQAHILHAVYCFASQDGVAAL